MAENDWTSAQVAKYSDRLLGFCSVNPLRSYALEEIARCAKDPNLRSGLKLHFGNSDVDLDNPEQLAQVRQVFRVANQHGMAITVHMHANIDRHRPYGRKEARIFLEQLLPEAPDVTVQIAHLAGGGGYDDPTIDEALSVFVEAIERKDPRMNERVLRCLWYRDTRHVGGQGGPDCQADSPDRYKPSSLWKRCSHSR